MTPIEAIAQRVRELRKRRGWAAQRLADEMTRVGMSWDRQVVTKLENGHRKSIDLEEVLALAYVLNVAPVNLIVPTRDAAYRVLRQARPDDELSEADAVSSTDDVREWLRGTRPLRGTDVRQYFSEVSESEFRSRFGHGSAWTPPPEDGGDDAS